LNELKSYDACAGFLLTGGRPPCNTAFTFPPADLAISRNQTGAGSSAIFAPGLQAINVVAIWSVWFQVPMKKRGDSWLCAAELRTRVGLPSSTSSARSSPRLRQRRDNARCNYICSFDEHVVRVDNMRQASRLTRQAPAIRVPFSVAVMTSLGESSRRHTDDAVCTLPLEALVIICSQTI
jgi:hypothetical protein